MKEIKCLHDRIMIKMPKVSDKTDGGLLLSEDAQREIAAQQEAEGGFKAIATHVGPDCKDVKVGDYIIIDNHQVPVLEFNGERYAVVREYNVICVAPLLETESLEA